MRHFPLLGFGLILLTAAAGCNREKPEPQPKPDDSYPTITLSAEQIESKTYVGTPGENSIPILWSATDEIWVRSAAQEAGKPGNRFTTTESGITSGGKVAAFTGQAPETGPYVAVYPYSFVNASSDNSSVVLDVPRTQQYAENSFGQLSNITAAVWASGKTMQFKNLSGALRLRFTGSKTVGSIVIADKDPASILWGKCTLGIAAGSEVSSVTWSNESSARNELELSCPSGVALSETETQFWFVVPVGAFAKGFVCTVYDTSGAIIKAVDTDTDCTVKRNTVNDMAVIETDNLPFSGGKGTEAQPYRIATSADLQQLAALCNGEDSDKYCAAWYEQVADIDMNGVSVACIGNASAKAFKGRYNGGGFKISNLSPAPDGKNAAGMFGYTDGAEIKDLKIDGYTNNGTSGQQGVIAGSAKNSVFSGISIEAHAHFVECACGGVAGYVEGGKIENCSFSGFIQDEKYADFQGVTVVSCVGGIAGYLENASIINCSFKGDATANGEQLGGIVGQAKNSTIENCRIAEGSTVTGDNYYAGGIAGEALGNCTISGCEVQAHVICWYPGAAGIVAWLQSGTIKDCVVGSHALVRTGQHQAGGIVAYIYHKNTAQTVTIDGCSVYCDIAASYTVGGIVGEYNPTNDASKAVVSNCAYMGGEIIDAGYATSKWTMVGGLVAWARMGSTAASLDVVNCFSDPSVIRCDFPQATEVDMGGFIGEQGGANATVNISGCYNTLAPGRAFINGSGTISSAYYNYGAMIGNPTKTNLDHVYYVEGLPAFGKANSGTSTACEGMSVGQMCGGTLLSRLNEFKSSYSGPVALKGWVAGPDGFPVLEGMIANPSSGKKKALRVSLIGDSLSTFDGYAPHGYQGSRAPNGYRCHYPTGDGNVTSASQTYWYMLTYDYLSNAVWDTNLAFSGTAVTRCTNTSYSDKYWYGQDFCTRYIENGGMGSPDIVIINGGANDWAHGIYNILGNVKLQRYPSTTPHRPDDAAMNAVYAVADACKTLEQAKALPDATFIEAYVKLVRMISLQYPYVKIVVLIHDTLTPDVEESLIHIADHYSNCRYVDLYAVNGFNDLGWNFEYLAKGYQPNMPKHDFNWSNIVTSGDLRQNCSDHYSAVAMKFIAEKIYNELGSWLESSASYNDSGNGGINDFDNINGAW